LCCRSQLMMCSITSIRQFSVGRPDHDFRLRTRPERSPAWQTHSSLSVRRRHHAMARMARGVPGLSPLIREAVGMGGLWRHPAHWPIVPPTGKKPLRRNCCRGKAGYRCPARSAIAVSLCRVLENIACRNERTSRNEGGHLRPRTVRVLFKGVAG
jgi:hypothetical protein